MDVAKFMVCKLVMTGCLALSLGGSSALAQLDSEPEAIFIVTPGEPAINIPVRVDASQSYDRPNNGPIASYNWNWGDGTAIGTGVTAQHTYTSAGRYTITLTVFDSETPANTDAAIRVINVSVAPPPDGSNRPPVARLEIVPDEAGPGETVTFDASASSDPDSDPITYRVQFGDGEESGFTTDPEFTHEYTNSGTFTVRLTVRDDSNASNETTSSINITGPSTDNRSPVALIATGPRTGAAPATLNFDGRISYDLDGDPLIYLWTFTLDGEIYDEQNGSVVNQLFDEPGDYSVVLEVRDTNGGTSSSEAQDITIADGGEPVEPPPPAPIPEPEPPPPSYTQRPPSVCGIGILLPMLACLMGLFGGRVLSRRR